MKSAADEAQLKLNPLNLCLSSLSPSSFPSDPDVAACSPPGSFDENGVDARQPGWIYIRAGRGRQAGGTQQ